MAGTSPSIAALRGGGFEVAFQAKGNSLWTFADNKNYTNWRLDMMPGTSPSIAALAGGGFDVAFEADDSSLRTVGSAPNTPARNPHRALGTLKTTVSGGAAVSGRSEVAFGLGDISAAIGAPTSVVAGDMNPGRISPSVTGLWSGGFEVALHTNSTDLWTVGLGPGSQDTDWQVGMTLGPSISPAT